MNANSAPVSDGLRRGLIIFFSAIIALGMIGLWFLVVRPAIRDYRIAYLYERADAKVLEVRMEGGGSSSETVRGRKRYRSSAPFPIISFRFEANGKTVTTSGYDSFGGRDASPAEYGRFRVGETVSCWYDPTDPKQAVLVADWRPKRYLMGLIPLGFIFVAGVFLRGITATPQSAK